MTFDLEDSTLFGNEAAEDEDAAVFDAYFLRRSDYSSFGSNEHKFLVARAYKGEGKSAILREAESTIAKSHPASLRIVTTAANIAVAPDTQSPDDWVRAWKHSILERVAQEVGTRIGFALGDDAIGLVEEAERAGFRARNLVSTILDRAKPKLKDFSLDLRKLGIPSPSRVLQRFPRDYPIWLFIDDVDLNYDNSDSSKAKIASLMTACRQLVNLLPELHIRTSIRPNIWVIIKREAEAMSHVEQYMVDLTWQTVDLRNLLAERLKGYLKRTNQGLGHFQNKSRQQNEEQLIAELFEPKMPWGGVADGEQQTRPPHVVLGTLSRQRPRWLIELCKEAAKFASRRESLTITYKDITRCLESFGERRVSDTIVEFRSMCPEIEEILTAFAKQAEDYKTDELITLIEKRILTHVNVKISGSVGNASAINIAQFLFQIGFITARRQENGGYQHYSYVDKPELLKSRTSVDQGLAWEIHPVFRQVLQIRDPSGTKYRRSSRR
ncbi:MAG: hypothetical protein IH944_01830 [Armatimonadetes bacterium]|nr:hypothetical protein [Armatimonadota bacterium]